MTDNLTTMRRELDRRTSVWMALYGGRMSMEQIIDMIAANDPDLAALAARVGAMEVVADREGNR